MKDIRFRLMVAFPDLGEVRQVPACLDTGRAVSKAVNIKKSGARRQYWVRVGDKEYSLLSARYLRLFLKNHVMDDALTF